MKATNVYYNCKFPLYCDFRSRFEPCFLMDTRSGEVWCDTRPKNSQSEDEQRGYVKRISINGNFVDDDDVSEFIDNNLKLVQKYLDDKISYELFEHVIVENSYRWNDGKIICESFSKYRELCSLGEEDIRNEFNGFNSDVSEYARSLVDGDCYGIYFKDCTYEEIADEIKEYLEL